jgi:hypothetical protein
MYPGAAADTPASALPRQSHAPDLEELVGSGDKPATNTPS